MAASQSQRRDIVEPTSLTAQRPTITFTDVLSFSIDRVAVSRPAKCFLSFDDVLSFRSRRSPSFTSKRLVRYNFWLPVHCTLRTHLVYVMYHV